MPWIQIRIIARVSDHTWVISMLNRAFCWVKLWSFCTDETFETKHMSLCSQDGPSIASLLVWVLSMWVCVENKWKCHLFMGKSGHIYELNHLNTLCWWAWELVWRHREFILRVRRLHNGRAAKQVRARHKVISDHWDAKPQSEFPQWLSHWWLRVRKSIHV